MKFSSAILAAFAVGSVAGRDYGLFVENQLKAKSSQLFGFEAPISDADVAVSIPRAAGQPAEERQQLAAGLSVSYVTRKVAMHGDMIAFWPNDTEYTHLIVCNEGGRAGTTPGGGGGLNSSIQRIEVATGNVETILHGMSRCDGIRTTQWGTVLATEENGADGGAYEIIDPLSTTGNWLASRGAMGGDADIRKAIDSVVPSSSIVKRTALASQSWEGLEVLSNGVVIGGDELRPNKDKDGGAIFKFVPTNLYDCGAVVRPNQLCPNLISDLSESPLVSGTNYALQAVCSGYDDWGKVAKQAKRSG